MDPFKWFAFLGLFFVSSSPGATPHREWKSEGREIILFRFLGYETISETLNVVIVVIYKAKLINTID